MSYIPYSCLEPLLVGVAFLIMFSLSVILKYVLSDCTVEIMDSDVGCHICL